MTLTLSIEARKDVAYEDRVLAGILLIRAFEPDAMIVAEHDQIWFGQYERTSEQMREGERELMTAWGWFEDADGWSHFV